MTMFQIKHRWTAKILFECELTADEAGLSASVRLGIAVKKANLARANLAGANLARADLAGANLAGANLAGANLARAYLARANLARADLAGANLEDADIAGANLAGTNLVDGGQRSDGYRFVGWLKDGILMIRAGRRNMTVAEYRAHNAALNNATLCDETSAILDHIETVARIRGLV